MRRWRARESKPEMTGRLGRSFERVAWGHVDTVQKDEQAGGAVLGGGPAACPPGDGQVPGKICTYFGLLG